MKMKAKASVVHTIPVLFFRRTEFANFLARKGVDPEMVSPPLGFDPLDFEVEVSQKSFSYPYIKYNIDMTYYPTEKKNELVSELNCLQPDF